MITSPSIKKLRETFDLDAAQAKLIKDLCAARDDRDALQTLIEARCPATHGYTIVCCTDPYHGRLWRTTLVLHAVNCILDMSGVESLDPDGDFRMHPPAYEYCNAGDTYATTLIYKRATDRLFIGNWGDIVEREGM